MYTIKSFILNNLFNVRIAIEAVLANKIRAFLTALGIIFGVAAVITMLAIGNGAQEEILKQIKMVGVNNIFIQPLKKDPENNTNKASDNKEKRKFTPGLTLDDATAITQELQCVDNISPEVFINTAALREGQSQDVKLIGVTPGFFSINNLTVAQGRVFNKAQLEGLPVCVIGKSIQSRFFNKENPIGKYIKVGSNWLEIVGVLEDRKVSESAVSKLGLHDYNADIYTPIKCVLLRYKNRISINTPKAGGRGMNMGDNNEKEAEKNENYHQLDKIVVQIATTEQLNAATEVIGRILKRKHNNVIDFEITIPELLLKQQQRTKDIFNQVLAAIASISLVVGGIGIMNIMLASVLERIKEIGIRLAIGATKRDIIVQFLCEAVFISISGGVIGIILGISLSSIVSKTTEITTIVSVASIIMSFGVSVAVGLIFGIMPARKAAMEDPIKSLRYE